MERASRFNGKLYSAKPNNSSGDCMRCNQIVEFDSFDGRTGELIKEPSEQCGAGFQPAADF